MGRDRVYCAPDLWTLADRAEPRKIGHRWYVIVSIAGSKSVTGPYGSEGEAHDFARDIVTTKR